MSNKNERLDRSSKLRQAKYKSRMGSYNDSLLEDYFLDIDERLNEIESKVFKKHKRIYATRAQRMLLLHHLGILEHINSLDLSINKKAKLIAVLIDLDADNIETDLGQVGRRDSDLKTETNYKFLVSFFEELGMEDKSYEADRILTSIRKKKEEQQSKDKKK